MRVIGFWLGNGLLPGGGSRTAGRQRPSRDRAVPGAVPSSPAPRLRLCCRFLRAWPPRGEILHEDATPFYTFFPGEAGKGEERGAGADTGGTTPADGRTAGGWVAAAAPAAPQGPWATMSMSVSPGARVFLPLCPDFVSQDEIGDEA